MKTVQELAHQLRRSKATVRRWLWFLQIRPSQQKYRWYETKRGARKALTNLYPVSAATRLKRAMKEAR